MYFLSCVQVPAISLTNGSGVVWCYFEKRFTQILSSSLAWCGFLWLVIEKHGVELVAPRHSKKLLTVVVPPILMACQIITQLPNANPSPTPNPAEKKTAYG